MSKNLLLRNERRKKGWSQQLLADFASVSLSTIERAERGEPLRIDNIQRICECLKKSPQDLGLVQLAESTPATEGKRTGAFLNTTATSSGNIITSNTPHILFSDTAAGRSPLSKSLQPNSFLDLGILDRLEGGLFLRPKLDHSSLAHLQFVAAELKRQLVQGRSTNWSGFLFTAINQLGYYTHLVESNIERTNQISALIGENCLLIADILFNMHEYGNAERYYKMTLRIARETPDKALYAIAAGRYGLLLTDSERFDEAEQLIEQALRLAGQEISSIVCSWLWAVKAEAHASKQEEKSCCTALEAAKEQLALHRERLSCYIFSTDLVASVYSETKLLGFEGASYLRLRQPRRSQQVLAISQQLARHAHHQSLIHIDFSRSFIQQEDPHEASAYASRALDFIQQTGSPRAFQRILSLREDLYRWDSLTAVRALDERISLAKQERNSNG